MDAIIEPAAEVNGGELRRGSTFYALPREGAGPVLRLVVLQIELIDTFERRAVPYQVRAVGGAAFLPRECYLSEREAVAVALDLTRMRAADLARRELCLVEQARRLGLPAGAEEGADLKF